MADMRTPADGGGRCESDRLAGTIDRRNTPDRVELQARRERLPSRRRSVVFNFEHGGLRYRATASRFADGRLAEIFLTASKPGSATQAHADTAAVLASLLLQHGVPADAVARAVNGSAIAAAIELAETS